MDDNAPGTVPFAEPDDGLSDLLTTPCKVVVMDRTPKDNGRVRLVWPDGTVTRLYLNWKTTYYEWGPRRRRNKYYLRTTGDSGDLISPQKYLAWHTLLAFGVPNPYLRPRGGNSLWYDFYHAFLDAIPYDGGRLSEDDCAAWIVEKTLELA